MFVVRFFKEGVEGWIGFFDGSNALPKGAVDVHTNRKDQTETPVKSSFYGLENGASGSGRVASTAQDILPVNTQRRSGEYERDSMSPSSSPSNAKTPIGGRSSRQYPNVDPKIQEIISKSPVLLRMSMDRLEREAAEQRGRIKPEHDGRMTEDDKENERLMRREDRRINLVDLKDPYGRQLQHKLLNTEGEDQGE